MYPNFETFNWSPEGWGQNVGVNHFRTGGILKRKTSPGGGGTPPTSCPKCWTVFSHWRLRYPYRRGHATKIRRPLATTCFFLPQTHRHGITLFHFWSWIISCPSSHQTFPPFLQRSSISTLDWSQTTCYCNFSCFSPHFTQTTAPWHSFQNLMCKFCICPVLKM